MKVSISSPTSTINPFGKACSVPIIPMGSIPADVEVFKSFKNMKKPTNFLSSFQHEGQL